MITNQDLH